MNHGYTYEQFANLLLTHRQTLALSDDELRLILVVTAYPDVLACRDPEWDFSPLIRKVQLLEAAERRN